MLLNSQLVEKRIEFYCRLFSWLT